MPVGLFFASATFTFTTVCALGSITFACILRPILHFHGNFFLFSSQPNVIMSLLLFNTGKCTASLLLSRARVHSKFTLNVSACRLHFYKWHKCQFSASCGATQEVLFIVCARARAPLVRWNGGRERERERCGKMRMFHSEFSLVKVYVYRLC